MNDPLKNKRLAKEEMKKKAVAKAEVQKILEVGSVLSAVSQRERYAAELKTQEAAQDKIKKDLPGYLERELDRKKSTDEKGALPEGPLTANHQESSIPSPSLPPLPAIPSAPKDEKKPETAGAGGAAQQAPQKQEATVKRRVDGQGQVRPVSRLEAMRKKKAEKDLLLKPLGGKSSTTKSLAKYLFPFFGSIGAGGTAIYLLS